MYDGRMQCLDLFSGVGGMSIALEPYCRTVAFCDIDNNCRSIISQRAKEGRMEDAPIFGDIQSISNESLAAAGVLTDEITCITAGFPCQDISSAGRQMGVLGNTRSSLWREVLRVAGDLPRVEFILLENIPSILSLGSKGITPVLQGLQEAGFTVRWTVISCRDIGACHLRERWFALCHKPADPAGVRLTQTNDLRKPWPKGVHELLRRCDGGAKQGTTTWPPELPPLRVHHGVSSGLDTSNRLRCGAVGNAVSPPVARLAFETLLGLQYLADPAAYTKTSIDLEDVALDHEEQLPFGWYVEINSGKLCYWCPTGRSYKTLETAKKAANGSAI